MYKLWVFLFCFVLVPMCFLEYCFSSFVLVLERIQGIGISALANCEHAMLCDSRIHDRVRLCIG
jgi:predicted unusual protein kinase regulating ubiquinone biosynthesis (AarF/ABC1/UbiB family)